MKINLNGYDGIPDQKVYHFENEQTIELYSDLNLTEVVVIFTNANHLKTVVVRDANGFAIPIPKEMLEPDTTLQISVKLMNGSKIARTWQVRPITLKLIESGLEARVINAYEDLRVLKEEVAKLQEQNLALEKEVAMLKERINPLKDII